MIKKTLSWIEIFTSNTPWPTTLVVGLVHGNEIVGKHVIDYITHQAKKKKHIGTVITLIANIDAYKKNVRFIDTDLNRAFMDIKRAKNNEEKRAQTIKSFFADIPIDYIFDIHSTPSKSKPMILCTSQKESFQLAKRFPINYVVRWLIDSVEWIPLMKHFTAKGTKGLAFEAGWHEDQKTINKGKKIGEIIRRLHNKKETKNVKRQTVIQTSECIHTSDNRFKFSKDYKGFEVIHPGEIRGRDSKKSYSFTKEKIIMIPNTKFQDDLKKKGKTWLVYFGEKQK